MGVNKNLDLLNSHTEFNRNEMQDYIVLFVFIANKRGEPLKKIKTILNISIKQEFL